MSKTKTKTTTDCIMNINMEHLRMQIAQLEEENHNHREHEKYAATFQTTLEDAARNLCIRILEQRCKNLDEEAQAWNDMDILKLIRIATMELDQISMDQADEIVDLMQMICFYQEENRKLKEDVNVERHNN